MFKILSQKLRVLFLNLKKLLKIKKIKKMLIDYYPAKYFIILS